MRDWGELAQATATRLRLSVARSGTKVLKDSAYVPAAPHRLLMPVPALPNPNLLYWRKAPQLPAIGAAIAGRFLCCGGESVEGLLLYR